MEMWQFSLLLSTMVILSLLVMFATRNNSQPEKLTRLLADELERVRREAAENQQRLRQELQQLSKSSADSLLLQLGENSAAQLRQLQAFASRLGDFSTKNEQRFDNVRLEINAQLEKIRTENAVRLEEMNRTVNEKLHTALESRLKESFSVVGERLDAVHKGLGEMQKLAADVGGLQRVLANVKSRGILGETQLAGLLEQVLARPQYDAQVVIGTGREAVDFAVRLPARDDEGGVVLLPLDAKFPVEDYQRLLDAQNNADAEAVDASRKALAARLRFEARSIQQKYINPPQTTDFAVMYLPSEGLYAEALNIPGLQQLLQNENHVAIAGPGTLYAFLHSLQMGFRTLAVERKSSEIWKMLGAVKNEFVKFERALSDVEKKIQEAGNKISELGTRSRAVVRQVKSVDALDDKASSELLGTE